MGEDLITRAQRVFEELADEPSSEAERRLSALGDPELENLVRKLLASDRDRNSFLSTPAIAERIASTVGGSAPGREETRARIPLRVGRYDVVSLIGEGGMGAVYEAIQDNPRRPVAVKVIRGGLVGGQVLSRFRREAEILGKLHHPGLAAVYEAGTAEIVTERGVLQDQPFIAMELVRGEALLEYCAARRLVTNARLELLARVCDAVQHAHEEGVVHRDLKPGNVLVDESGQPKVLDFGIARALSDEAFTQQTQTGQILGTVPYMSPEQISGDHATVNARSDVYALGVMMFELLAGRLPYDLRNKPIAEAARIIRDAEPTRLSSAGTAWRGDLETIVAKAIEKDPGRRYQSAAELADDLRRFLSDEPILARPPSTFYQFRKFARRNRALVGGVAATIVVLAGGVVATSVALAREAVQRAQAEKNLVLATTREGEARAAQALAEKREREAITAKRRAETAAEFSKGILSAISPSRSYGRDTALLRETLGDAVGRVRTDLAEYPEIQAEMFTTIGETYRNVAAFDEAVSALQETLDIRKKLDGDNSPAVMDATLSLAGAMKSAGEAKEAAELVDGTIATLRSRTPVDTSALAAHLRMRGEIALDIGDLDGGGDFLAESLTLARAGGDAGEIADSEGALGGLKRRLGRLDEARTLLSSAAKYLKSKGPSAAIQLGGVLNGLALVERFGNNLDSAKKLYEEALEVRRKLYDRPHPDVAVVLLNLGKLYDDLGEYGKAEPLLRESLAMHREIYKDDHQGKAVALDRLANTLVHQGKTSEAEPLMEEALRMFKATAGEAHPYTATSMSTLGQLFLELGRPVDAEKQFRDAMAVMGRAIKKEPEVYTAPLAGLLSEALARQGRHEEAAAALQDALAMYLRMANPNPGEIAWTKGYLCRELVLIGKVDEAETVGREAVAAIEGSIDRRRGSQVRMFYAQSLVALGRFAEAEKVIDSAAEILTKEGRSPLEMTADEYVTLYSTWLEHGGGERERALLREWEGKKREQAEARKRAASGGADVVGPK